MRDQQAADAAGWSVGFSVERKTHLGAVALPAHQPWEGYRGQCVSGVVLRVGRGRGHQRNVTTRGDLQSGCCLKAFGW